jgi:hypothetical protein
VSERTRDESVDTSYSKPENSKGYKIKGENRYMISTRHDGSIKIIIRSNGFTSVEFIDCKDNLNENQQERRDQQSPQDFLKRRS